VPDHSTFSKNRHGRLRESGAIRFVFEQVIKRCIVAVQHARPVSDAQAHYSAVFDCNRHAIG
jgi:hypothetical protein